MALPSEICQYSVVQSIDTLKHSAVGSKGEINSLVAVKEETVIVATTLTALLGSIGRWVGVNMAAGWNRAWD